MAARLAGDEFAVVLPGHGVAEARDLAVTASACSTTGATRRSRSPAARWRPGPGLEYPGQLLRAADSAQYASKRRGGGQVCTAEASALRDFTGERPRVKKRGLAERLDATSASVLEPARRQARGR